MTIDWQSACTGDVDQNTKQQ